MEFLVNIGSHYALGQRSNWERCVLGDLRNSCVQRLPHSGAISGAEIQKVVHPVPFKGNVHIAQPDPLEEIRRKPPAYLLDHLCSLAMTVPQLPKEAGILRTKTMPAEQLMSFFDLPSNPLRWVLAERRECVCQIAISRSCITFRWKFNSFTKSYASVSIKMEERGNVPVNDN
jgi:hypothetical protein